MHLRHFIVLNAWFLFICRFYSVLKTINIIRSMGFWIMLNLLVYVPKNLFYVASIISYNQNSIIKDIQLN